jgi:predicted DNA-binding protein YlxM (UPF0122 family)
VLDNTVEANGLLHRTVATNDLLDVYGALLTDRQRRVLELRYGDDWSLAEIAQDLGVTRQAVFDIESRAVHVLLEYERKLGIVRARAARRAAVEQLARRLRSDYGVADAVLEQLRSLE